MALSSLVPPRGDTTELDMRSESLSISNQIAPRGYVHTAFCFPFEGGLQTQRAAFGHMRASLAEMARDHPFFAGVVEPESGEDYPERQQGRLQLTTSGGDCIPLHCQYAVDTFGCTYDELKARKFPQGSFVGPRYAGVEFGGASDPRAPVLKMCLIFIQGGLIMVISNHHSMMDGGSRKRLFDCLAAYTKGQSYDVPMTLQQDDTDERIDDISTARTFVQLLSSCQEYAVLRDKSGPCEPNFLEGGVDPEEIEVCGKIFRFTDEVLKELRALLGVDAITNPDMSRAVQHRPSVYLTLAALTWAHISRARLETERNASHLNNESTATLMTPVSWKEHAFKAAHTDYFGNAVATIFTRTSITHLLRACTSIRGLSELTRRITDAVKAVNEPFMCQRLALYKRAPDVRTLGLDFDLRNPQDYTFNTWRWFGGNTEWTIPGVTTTKADAIRRASTSHKLGAIVILPASDPTADQELYIELPKVSMDRLCRDQEWMKWVAEVIE